MTRLLIIALLSLATATVLPAQAEDPSGLDILTLGLTSGDSQRVFIDIRGDWGRDRTLTVQLDSQKVIFEEYSGLVGARVVCDRFLELEHSTQCGTNCKVQEYHLLYMKDGRLQKAFSTCSHNESTHTALECKDREGDWAEDHELWKWDFSLIEDNGVEDDYKLVAARHHFMESECTAAYNIDVRDTLTLTFDPVTATFLNPMDTTAARFFEPN